MKSIKMVLSAGISAAIIAAISSSAFAASAGVISTESGSLSVRSTASVSSARLALLPKDSLVTLVSKNGSWWLVEYADGRYGYCSSNYISQLSSGKEGYVKTKGGNLNIRSSASSSSSIKDKLPNGEGVIILSEKNGWCRVLYNGTSVGYAASEYIAAGTSPQSGVGNLSLGVIDYKQYDSRWANLKVSSSGKSMRAIGCVTSALAETESYRLHDSSITPAVMLKRLSYNSSGDVYWPSNYQSYTGSGYLSQLYSLLKSGKPVIFGAKNSAGKMHWVVVTGYNGAGLAAKNFIINDPGSETRKTLADLLNEYPRFYKMEYYV